VFFLKHCLPIRHCNQELVKIDRAWLVHIDLVDDVLNLGNVMMAKVTLVNFKQLFNLNCAAVINIHGLENVCELLPLFLVNFSQRNKCLYDCNQIVSTIIFLQISYYFLIDYYRPWIFHLFKPPMLKGTFSWNSLANISVQH